MSDKQVEGAETFLGITPKVEEDEATEEVKEARSLAEEPEDVREPDGMDDEEEASSEDDVEQAEVEEDEGSVLQRVAAKFSQEAADTDDRQKLEREIEILKAQWKERNEVLDKVLAGREEKPKEADPLDTLSSPEVGRMFREALESDDPGATARLLRQFSEQIADHKVSTKTKELEARLQQYEQTAQTSKQQEHIKSNIASAVTTLQKRGGVCAELVNDFYQNGERSHLYNTWLSQPEIMRNAQLMAVTGIGLANLFESAAGTSQLRAVSDEPAEQEAVQQSTPKDGSTGTRPKASRGSTKLSPKSKKEPDPADIVLQNLRAAGGGAGDWLNSW